MLTQYTNIDEILSADKSVSAKRLSKKAQALLTFPNNRIDFNPGMIGTNNNTELHIYANETWITGDHAIQCHSTPQYSFIDKDTNKEIRFNSSNININLFKQFDDLKLTAGNYRFVINFFKNCIGNYGIQHLKVDKISPDKTEIRLKAIDKTNSQFLQEINTFINTVNLTTKFGNANTYLLNFSKNQCFQFVNSVVIGEYLYVKLLNPIDTSIETDFKCWVVQENKYPYVDNVVIYSFASLAAFNDLSGPNWNAYNKTYISSETNLQNWNDLLGSSVQTSQEIVDAYFSGSLSGVKLNIDYTDFNNFIFYSSAAERVDNFKYKLQLLETYAAQSASLTTLSGSVAVTNAIDYETNKKRLIGGFDLFEKFLYYDSSSGLFSNEIPSIDPNVLRITGSYITPAPKSNSTYPYTLYPITSSQFGNWYNQLSATASLYDTQNVNLLYKAIPMFIRLDTNNTGLESFVNVLGQHYDILYTYINEMTKINKREHNPKIGMPNELLYSVAKQFGWHLTDGNQYQNLWEYVLGTNEAGVPLTGSNSVGEPSLPGRDMTYHVWRRIVNNIPGMLKSKGSKRSIQALLACYGIPQSMITIKEYGGPRIDRAPIYEKLNFDYALDLITNPAGTVRVFYGGVSDTLNSVELRFRTDNVLTNPTMSNTMHLYTVGTNNVTVDYTRGTLGTVRINGTASADIECFDGTWVNTVLRTSGSNLELVAKKSKYGKIVASVTASSPVSFPTGLHAKAVTLGGTSTGAVRLEGELQELRLWNTSLDTSPIENHTKAPAAYDGNVDAYNELFFRVPLTQKINHTLTSSLYGVEPKQSGVTASFASWTNATPYDSLEETYYFDGISLGAGTFDDNKIRLEANELVGSLDFLTRAERSQFDKAPLDSKKLGVYFSPQTMVNEDIIAQLGFQSLDDYIGDPADQTQNAYPQLIQQANNYWKKYNTKNDINAYLRIFSLFDLSFFRQLEQLLPARADEFTGLLIQPNILERSKNATLPQIERSLKSYNSELLAFTNTVTGSYDVYNAEYFQTAPSASAADDEQLTAYLTSSVAKRYDGMTYCYPELIRSGSGWLAVTTPFWTCEAILPTITGSRLSEFREILTSVSFSYSSSGGIIYGGGSYGGGPYGITTDVTSSFYNYAPAQFQDYLPLSLADLRYNGCKMTSPDFNINSPDTVDGGPVVEYIEVNPNQIITQPASQQGGLTLDSNKFTKNIITKLKNKFKNPNK